MREAELTLWRGLDFDLVRESTPRARLILRARDASKDQPRHRAARVQQLLAEVVSPHLVRVRGPLQGGNTGLELEDPGGETLRQRLTRGPLGPDEVVRVVAHVAEALRALHERDLVHRSVCPELILIADDGVALVPGEALKPTDDPVLTGDRSYVPSQPTYTAPEVLRNGQAGPASDNWALGIVLFEAVTGQPPVRAADPFELETLLRRGLPSLPAGSPPRLEEVYRGLTVGRSAERWTASAATDALVRRWPSVQRAPDSPAKVDDRPLVLGQYQLLEKIAAGGFASVYKGWDPALMRPVAIKILDGGEDRGSSAYDDCRARFDRERRVQARLDEHPNIVRIHQTGEHEGNPVLVLEFMDGPNLADWTAERQPSGEEIARVGSQIAAALSYAHGRDVVHRDVKPRNVLADKTRSRVKLGDFGIAQVPLESQRGYGTRPHPGTTAYMAPEQAQGQDYLDGRADVYALGCTLYEFASGVIYKTQRRPLAWVRTDLSTELTSVIDRCTAVDPERRFQTAEDVRQAFEELLLPKARPREAWWAAVPARLQQAVSTSRLPASLPYVPARRGTLSLLGLGLLVLSLGAAVASDVGGSVARVFSGSGGTPSPTPAFILAQPPSAASVTPVPTAAAVVPVVTTSTPEPSAVPTEVATAAAAPTGAPTATPTRAPTRTATTTATPATAAPTATPFTVALTGKVLAPNSGRTLPGVVVRAWSGNTLPSQIVATATSDATGLFAMSVPPGRYWLSFVPPSSSGATITWYAKAPWAGAGTQVDAGTAKSVTAFLLRAYDVTGTVKDATSGAPVFGVQVSASLANAPVAGSLGLAVTDAQGAFAMTLPAGEYTMTLSSLTGSFATQQWSRTLTVDFHERGLVLDVRR